MTRRGYFCFLVGLACVFGSRPLRADTFVVLKGDVAGLKAAITASNTNGQDDLIVLSGFTAYGLTTIDNAANGLPVITSDGGHSVTFSGHGGKIVRSSTGSPPQFRIFQIGSGAHVTIENLTMSGGSVSVYNGGGGAIYNNGGTLTLSNCVISGNSAIGQNGTTSFPGGGALGGGVYNDVGTTTAIGCTFSGNTAVAGNGGAGSSFNGGEAEGGAIYPASSLTNCIFTGNSCTGGTGGSASSAHNGGNGGSAVGGAAWASNMTGCTFSSNFAQGGAGGAIGSGVHPGTGGDADGGAAAISTFGTTGIADCNFDSNSATAGATSGGASGIARGGAVVVFTLEDHADLLMTGSTFTSNVAFSSTAADGGGLSVSPASGAIDATLRNCTFSGNSAGNGGAIYGVNGGSQPPPLVTVSLYHCTLSGNNASSSGGAFFSTGNTEIFLANTILKKGSGNNIASGAFSLGHNICDDSGTFQLTGAGDLINTDPQLATATPQDNGGPTKTIALLSTSPAVDHANEAYSSPRDQRGYFRAGVSDTGTFEYQGGLIGRVTAITRTGPTLNDITVSFEAISGLTYILQRKVNLTDASWGSIPNANPLTATGDDIESITAPNDASLDQVFYRVSYSSGP